MFQRASALERALAAAIENWYCDQAVTSVVADRCLNIALHQERHPWDGGLSLAMNFSYELGTGQDLPEPLSNLLQSSIPKRPITLGNIVARLCTTIFLLYFCEESDVSREKRLVMKRILKNLQGAKRIYMPGNLKKLDPSW